MFSELCLEWPMRNDWQRIGFVEKKLDVIKSGWSEICVAFSESRDWKQQVRHVSWPTSNNVSASAKYFNRRFIDSEVRISCTRLTTPLSLLAIGCQAFSIPCPICRWFSCHRKHYFFTDYYYAIAGSMQKWNERLLLSFLTASLIYPLSLVQLLSLQILFVSTDAKSGCRTHRGRT